MTESPAPQAAVASWSRGLVCVLIPVLFVGIYLSWHSRVPGFLHFSGLLQGDTPTYLCNARMTHRSMGLSYASPHDLRDPPRAIYVQLPISVLGGLLALGLSPSAAVHLLRILFGALMFWLLALLVLELFPERRWFWPVFGLLALGGGWAWLAGIGADSFAAWNRAIHAQEAQYYWWYLNLYRNLTSPLELIYHVLLLAMLWALLRQRWGLAVGFLALGALSNPFLAVQMFGVYFFCALWCPRQRWPFHLAAVAVGLLFAFWYGLWIPSDPLGRSLSAQHSSTYGAPLAPLDMLRAYGPALLVLPALLYRPFRQEIFARFRPFLGLALWTLLLTQHSRLPLGKFSLLPMHFTRGYLFLGLWMLALAGLWWWAQRSESWGRRMPWIAVALALLVLPDNLSYTWDRYKHPPARRMVWSKSTEGLLVYLRKILESQRILAVDRHHHLSSQICSMTHHTTVFGAPLVTPMYRHRQKQLEAFLAAPGKVQSYQRLLRWKVRLLIVARRRKLALDPAVWRLSYQNRAWKVYALSW